MCAKQELGAGWPRSLRVLPLEAGPETKIGGTAAAAGLAAHHRDQSLALLSECVTRVGSATRGRTPSYQSAPPCQTKRICELGTKEKADGTVVGGRTPIACSESVTIALSRSQQPKAQIKTQLLLFLFATCDNIPSDPSLLQLRGGGSCGKGGVSRHVEIANGVWGPPSSLGRRLELTKTCNEKSRTL